MKIAIASNGNTPDACLDNSFARCAWFVIIDTVTNAIEYYPNQARVQEENAGPASVELMVEKKVNTIVSYEFGLRVKPLLDSHKIQLIMLKDTKRKISEIIDLLNHKSDSNQNQ